MIQVYKKNELFVIEDTITETIYPNLTREETVELLKKFDRDEPEDRCDFAIKEDNISFEYASIDDKDKIIANLEAKLAESEKKFIVANNLRKNADEVLLNYKTEKYGLDKTIQELRKMKLSLPEKEWYYKGFENCERQMSSHIADLTLEVKELKQQLAEKEKENLTLFSMLYKTLEKQGCENIVSTIEQMTNLTLEKQSNWFKGNCVKDQDKISFALEQLEKVKEEMDLRPRGVSKGWKNKEYDTLVEEDVYEVIDNQIKQLKEGK